MKLKNTSSEGNHARFFALHGGFFLINYVVKIMWSRRHEKQWLQNKSIHCAKSSKQTNKSREWGKAVNQRTGEQKQKITILLHTIPYYILTGNWKRKKNKLNQLQLSERAVLTLCLSLPAIYIQFWFYMAIVQFHASRRLVLFHGLLRSIKTVHV